MVYMLKLLPAAEYGAYVISFHAYKNNPFEFGGLDRAMCFLSDTEFDHAAMLREWADNNNLKTAQVKIVHNTMTDKMEDMLAI